MRLAVFTSQFPSKVSTFFARDMRALIEAGIDLDIFPIYDEDPTLWEYVPDILSDQVLPRQRVHPIRVGQAARRAITGLLPPARIAQTTSAVLASATREGPGPFAKSAYVVPKALAWAREFQGAFDHVLGYWGNYAATSALIFTLAQKKPVPFSMFLHAGTDLYRDRVYLAEKMSAARLIFTCSDFNRAFLKQHYPAQFDAIDRKLHVYHHGLDFAEFPFQPEGRLAHRIIAVGNFNGAKGFDYILHAGAELYRRGVPFEIQLVGDGPDKEMLSALACSLGINEKVLFTGWLPFEKVRDEMLKATMLVHASPGLGDGVPNVLKEATALGTPVIATEVSGLPEALEGGRHGLLVPPKDAEALADAIQRMLGDSHLRVNFARSARAYAESKYDLWRNGKQMAQTLYEA